MNERSATAALTTTYRDLMDDPTAVPAAPAPATVPLDAVARLLADTIAMRDAAQAQMDWLANNEPAAVNVVGSPDHLLYEAARIERDTYAAPLMGLQALINTARKA